MNLISFLFMFCLCAACIGCGRESGVKDLRQEQPAPSADTASSENMRARPRLHIDAEEVAFVIVDAGSDGVKEPRVDYFTNSVGEYIKQHSEIVETFRITNRCEIAKLVSHFNNLHKQPEGAVTFSGVLSKQIFISTNNSALANAFIIMNPTSCVLAKSWGVINKDGRFFSEEYYRPEDAPESESYANSLSVSGHEYAATVLKAMRKNSPDKVRQLEKHEAVLKKTLEEALGLGERVTAEEH